MYAEHEWDIKVSIEELNLLYDYTAIRYAILDKIKQQYDKEKTQRPDLKQFYINLNPRMLEELISVLTDNLLERNYPEQVNNKLKKLLTKVKKSLALLTSHLNNVADKVAEL